MLQRQEFGAVWRYLGRVPDLGKPGLSSAAALAAQIMSDAIITAGKAEALAIKLRPYLDRQHSNRTVSAWGRGDITPPAATMLAAALAMGIRLDDYLERWAAERRTKRELAAASRASRASVATLQRRLVALEREVGLVERQQEPETVDWPHVQGALPAVVSRIVGEGIAAVRTAAALSSAIAPLVDQTYAPRTVSAWGRRDVHPTADVLLAVAKVAGSSVDEALRQVRGLVSGDASAPDPVAQLERRLEVLEHLRSQAGGLSGLREAAQMKRLDDIHRVVQSLGESALRPWARAVPDSIFEEAGRDRRRAVNLLQGRLTDLQGALGIPWTESKEVPPEPSASDEGALAAWADEAIRILGAQVPAVKERLSAAEEAESSTDVAQSSG